jgi:hypothetical protein
LPETESKRHFFDSVVADGVHDGILRFALAAGTIVSTADGKTHRPSERQPRPRGFRTDISTQSCRAFALTGRPCGITI